MLILSGFSGLLDQDRIGELAAAGASASLVTSSLMHIVEVLEGIRDHPCDVYLLNWARHNIVHRIVHNHLIDV